MTRKRSKSLILAALLFVSAIGFACSNSTNYKYGGRALTPPDADGGIDLIPADGGSAVDVIVVDANVPADANVEMDANDGFFSAAPDAASE